MYSLINMSISWTLTSLTYLWKFSFRLEPIFTIAPTASKNDTRFRSVQKWLENDQLALITYIHDTLYWYYLNQMRSNDGPSFDEMNQRSSSFDGFQHDVADSMKLAKETFKWTIFLNDFGRSPLMWSLLYKLKLKR